MNATDKKPHKGPGRPKALLRRPLTVLLTPETIEKLGKKPAIKIRRIIERMVAFREI